jgi:phosphatidylglycerophosphate synthase
MSLREWMANSSNGKILEISSLGKIKTIVQMTGISMIIASPIIHLSYYFELSIIVLIIGALFGYFSAFKYLKESFSSI